MSDLVKQLRDGVVKSDGDNYHLCASDAMFEAADRIEQLEQHLRLEQNNNVKISREIERIKTELAAEKALADQLYEALYFERTTDRPLAFRAYRKARGM